jgi:hypothetical protein
MRYLDVTLVAQILSLSAFLTTSAVGQKLEPKFGPAVAYAEGVGPDSVSAADLRGNGVLDLVVANFCEIIGEAGNCEGGVSVLLGNGNGTFQAPVTYGTGAYQATSVAIGDVNGDGIPDLIVANTCGTLGQYGCDSQPGAVSVLLGKGDGTFQSAVVFSSGGLDSYSVAVADLRGDGTLDLVVTNTCLNAECTNGSIGVLLGNGDGTFQPAVSYDSGGYIAASVAIGDVSSDGIPDLLVANFCEYNECGTRNGEVGVLLGNGDGTFKPAVLYDSGGEFLVSVAVGDLRGNGILDVVAANEFSDDEGKKLRSDVGVLLGNGDGTFQTADSYPVDGISYPSYPAIGWGINAIVTADVNGDGIPDVAIVESCQTIQRYTDCVGNKEVNVYLGNGDGTFQAPIVYSSGGFIGLDLAIADVNGDGRPDLVVTNAAVSEEDDSQGSVAVLLNETSYSTKTALTSSPDPAAINQTVTFTATITSTPSVPNGEVVTFYDGKTELGTGTTTNGVATLSTSFAKEKTYTVKASYPGDAFRKASSGTVKQVVNP